MEYEMYTNAKGIIEQTHISQNVIQYHFDVFVIETSLYVIKRLIVYHHLTI